MISAKIIADSKNRKTSDGNSLVIVSGYIILNQTKLK